MYHNTGSRKPSGNRRRALNHRVGTFPCHQIDDKGRAFVLRQLNMMRGTHTAKIQGNSLTCIFTPQPRQSLNKLAKRISKLLRQVRQGNLLPLTPAFA